MLFRSVISIDASGNISESTQKTFTTKAPSNLTSVKVVSDSLGEAVITWKTSAKMTSIVEYGLTTEYGDSKESNTKVKEHELSISSLSSGETYHFRVKGEDENNNLYASNDYTFIPKSPPTISNIKVDSVSEHQATISFTTDVPTDSLVTYADLSNSENSGSQGKPELAANHQLELKNLSPGTNYSLVVKVRDEEGNETEETASNFTTGIDENPPLISQVRTESALAQSDKVQTIIHWETDEPANTSLIYKEGQYGEEKEVKINDNYTLNHVAVVTVFKPGTVYYFQVKSIDQAGNEAQSSEHAVLTPRRRENIVQIIINNFQEIFGWAGF